MSKLEINPDEEFLWRNYNNVMKLASKESGLKALIEDFSERYMLCPASSRKEYFSCFPGGLMYHSLFVRFWMKKASYAIAPEKFSDRSITVVSLLHDIGKVGTKEVDYYIRTNDDWQDSKGIYYETNPKIQYMKVPYRSLFLAQQYDIELTEDEFLAILLGSGQITDTYKEPKFVSAFKFAVQWAMKTEKEYKILWPK